MRSAKTNWCIKRVATVIVLKSGIAKEDALHGLSKKFILSRSEYVDKTSAVEKMRRETEKG